MAGARPTNGPSLHARRYRSVSINDGLGANHETAPAGDPGTGPEPMRFAVLCSSHMIEDWQAGCLTHLLSLDAVQLALIIIVPPIPGEQSLVRRGLALWDLYARFHVRKRSEALRRVSLLDLVPGAPILSIRGMHDGHGIVEPCEADSDETRAYGLDFILQFGGGTPTGSILRAARYGIWRFRRDIAPGAEVPLFWEVFGGKNLIRMALLRCTDDPDLRVVLQEGVLKTVAHSHVRTVDASLYHLVQWPARVCSDLRNGHAQYLDAVPTRIEPLIERRPTDLETVRFALVLLARSAVAASRVLFRNSVWNVGIVDAPISSFLTEGSPSVRWLPEKCAGFYADPFGLTQDDQLLILLEEFDDAEGKGDITAIRASRAGEVLDRSPAMRLPSHMAYPFIVRHNSSIYCVPDTSSVREVGLYQATRFPTEWHKVATLVEDFAAVDSTVFRHEGRWWLLCNGNDSGMGPPSARPYVTGIYTTLYAWHATDLLGPWAPHPENPLKIDVRSTRPAGTPFVHEGQLYRPAQDSTKSYGGAVVLNRIVKLTPTEFREEEAGRVEPDPNGPYPDGLHTLSAVGDLTLIDGRRDTFSWALPLKFRRFYPDPGRESTRSSPQSGALVPLHTRAAPGSPPDASCASRPQSADETFCCSSPSTVRASVIVPVYNNAGYIADCIHSILNQTVQDFELIVVDDASDDETPIIARAILDRRIIHLRNPRNMGPAAARNRGLSVASAPYVFFTDADCTVTERWLEEGLRRFSSDGCAGLEGRTYYVSENHQPTRSDRVVENLGYGQYITANMAYERTALLRAGMFDVRLRNYEDRDLALRVEAHGPIVPAPPMVAYHAHTKWAPKSFVSSGSAAKSAALIYKKHRRGANIRYRLYAPERLVTMFFPPLIFSRLLMDRFATARDYALFLLVYPRIVYERFVLWKECLREKVFLV